MRTIKNRFIAAVLATALLCGCSEEEKPANVYLPGELISKSSSTTTSTEKDENQYDGFIRPSSSSTTTTTTTRYPTATTPDTEPMWATDGKYLGKWYYNHISHDCQAVYRRLYYCASNGIDECDVSDLDVTYQEVYEAFWAFDYENPQFLELGDGYELTMIDERISNKVRTIKIKNNRMPSDALNTALETRAQAVLDGARELNSGYEQLKYIHDWLVENTTYSDTGAEYESEADGPIVYGQALCEGYSKAFMYLAQELGYPCICAVGVANLQDHMWNMVRIGRNWYNVDVTWDDPDNTDDTNFATELRHDYFLICDAEIRLDHRVIRPDMLPTSPYGYFPHGYDQDSNQ